MQRMQLSDIKIKDTFAATIPRKEKMQECTDYYRAHGTQDTCGGCQKEELIQCIKKFCLAMKFLLLLNMERNR